MALRRSWVRIPLGPLQPKAPVIATGVDFQSQDRSSRRSVRELRSPGESLNNGVCRTPLSNYLYLRQTPNSPVSPEIKGRLCLTNACEQFLQLLVSTGKARYSETEWRLQSRCNQGGTAECLFVPEWRRDFLFNLVCE
jgi:hypothetical protein